MLITYIHVILLSVLLNHTNVWGKKRTQSTTRNDFDINDLDVAIDFDSNIKETG